MRVAFLCAVPAALVASACARVPPLQSTGPGQAIDGAPNEAQAEVAGVVVRAAIGGWRGRPPQLEQRLTPVDVTVHNTSGRTIRLGPETFKLATPRGRERALDQAATASALRDLSGPRAQRTNPRIGTAGGPTFPGYDVPGNPDAPWSVSPAGTPIPPPRQWYDTQPTAGTLASGGRTSLLLFFGTPAYSLTEATFEVELVDERGARLGVVQLPFARD